MTTRSTISYPRAVTITGGRVGHDQHQVGQEFDPKALRPVAGSADICLITEDPLDDVLADLARRGVAFAEGPVQRTGAPGQLRSVYVRDPDGNLVEISNYLPVES